MRPPKRPRQPLPHEACRVLSTSARPAGSASTTETLPSKTVAAPRTRTLARTWSPSLGCSTTIGDWPPVVVLDGWGTLADVLSPACCAPPQPAATSAAVTRTPTAVCATVRRGRGTTPTTDRSDRILPAGTTRRRRVVGTEEAHQPR